MNEVEAVQPLLAKRAVNRTDMPDIPGHYSQAHDAWVVETASGLVPLITEAEKSVALFRDGPMTKVQGERDEIGSFALLESSTKTRAQLERDDQSGPTLSLIHELLTKTEVVQERDDANPTCLTWLPELATKTDTKRERDDQ